MPRIFIAITLPEPIQDQILSICTGVPNIKWIKKQAMHLTLHFLGNKDLKEKENIESVLNQIEFNPFDLTIKDVGYFGARNKAHVLWVGIEENETLTKLQSQMVSLLTDNNLTKPENRPFSAHITLARLKNVPISKLESFFNKNKEFELEAFQVNAFHLISSELKPSEAVYTIERSYISS